MQQALFEIVEADLTPIAALPSKPEPTPAPAVASAFRSEPPDQPAVPAHRVSSCTVCGGSGACTLRSNRARTIPCVGCAGIGRTVHTAAGLRLSLGNIAMHLRECGIEIPEHALFR
jgi:hypothetical protein